MEELKKVASLLRNKKQILVLTGAGMSSASGIPDFRSKTGFYSMAPEEILSHDFFYNYPEKFYEFLLSKVYYPDAKPNKGHHVLAKWEKENRVLHVITQNVDGLHQAAGNEKVIEFHGSLHRCICTNCKKVYNPAELLSKREAEKLYYVCDSCDVEINKRYIKPDVVLYGEMGYWLSGKPFHQIQCMAYDADLILVLGTTLQVYPFGMIPDTRNQDANTQMVIINKGQTPYDNKPWAHVIREDISEVLTQLDKLI